MSAQHCQLNTGNFIPSNHPPHWTPYAEAIADLYAIQIPLYVPIPTTLTGVALQRKTVVTDPLEYDALILGATIEPGNDADHGQSVFVNMFNLRDGIDWVAPNVLGAIPLTAIGGNGTQVTSVMRLPEAYFWPAHTRLQFNFSQPTGAAVTGGSITLIGVQLINPFTSTFPDCIDVQGLKIRAGSRMPWFACLPIGRQTYTTGTLSFVFNAGTSYLDYTPPTDCRLEIHDIHTTAFDTAGASNDPDNLFTKVSITGRRDMWTPGLSPFTGVFGDRTQVYPALPMPAPLMLGKNERLQFRFQNNTNSAPQKRVIVVRGVRLCEF